MTSLASTPTVRARRGLRTPVAWGVVLGGVQAASPLASSWLGTATVHALGLVVIAAVHLGFPVADGRWHVLAVETAVASVLVVVAAAAVSGSAWPVVVGLVGHGVEDVWQHRTQFVAGTRWWPPFCVAADWVAAVLIAAVGLLDGEHGAATSARAIDDVVRSVRTASEPPPSRPAAGWPLRSRPRRCRRLPGRVRSTCSRPSPTSPTARAPGRCTARPAGWTPDECQRAWLLVPSPSRR